MVKRFPQIHDGDVFNQSVDFSQPVFHPSRLDKPLHWRKPRRIGVCFLGDLFDDQVPFEWIDKVFEKICEGRGRHSFFILTKQVTRMAEWFEYAKDRYSGWFNNGHLDLWDTYLGVSITDQEDADRMTPELLRIPGKHWISIEPMIGEVDIDWALGEIESTRLPYIGWVVMGCESGPKRRPASLEWFRSIRDQCKAAGVPLWIKQLTLQNKICHVTGDINLFPEDLRIREYAKNT